MYVEVVLERDFSCLTTCIIKNFETSCDKLLASFFHQKIISVFLCGEKTILQLNKDHRGKAKVTDVLSWENKIHNDIKSDSILLLPYGEIAICVPQLQSQAKQNGWDVETELIRLFVHALAHLTGYDHQTKQEEEEMILYENKLLCYIGIENLYPPISKKYNGFVLLEVFVAISLFTMSVLAISQGLGITMRLPYQSVSILEWSNFIQTVSEEYRSLPLDSTLRKRKIHSDPFKMQERPKDFYSLSIDIQPLTSDWNIVSFSAFLSNFKGKKEISWRVYAKACQGKS